MFDKLPKIWALWFCSCKISKKKNRGREREQWEKTTQLWQCGICAVVCVQYMCMLVSVSCVCMYLCWGSEGHPEWRCRSAYVCVYWCRYLWSVCDGAYRLNPPPSVKKAQTRCKHTAVRNLLLIWIHVHIQTAFVPFSTCKSDTY